MAKNQPSHPGHPGGGCTRPGDSTFYDTLDHRLNRIADALARTDDATGQAANPPAPLLSSPVIN